MSQRRANLVLEWLRPDGISAFRIRCWCAGLDHEVGDEAVEGGGIVVAGCAEGEEVLYLIRLDPYFRRKVYSGGLELGYVPQLFWGQLHRKLPF